jgi:ketosteroid isomerase-like protein
VSESVIRQRIEDAVQAIVARDIDRVMLFYAPDIVSFDLNPPLRYAGTDNKRRAWQAFFSAYAAGPIGYELRELSVTTQGELAFVHSLNHVSGTVAGHTTDMWVRWTACFRQIDGAWLVVHDHVSVPADLEHGKAVLNLKP